MYIEVSLDVSTTLTSEERTARLTLLIDPRKKALFERLCAEAKLPMQTYVHRTDLQCGSTIGPITSTLLGVAPGALEVVESVAQIAPAREAAPEGWAPQTR